MMVFLSWLYFACIIVLGYHNLKMFFSSEMRKNMNLVKLISSLIVLLLMSAAHFLLLSTVCLTGWDNAWTSRHSGGSRRDRSV